MAAGIIFFGMTVLRFAGDILIALGITGLYRYVRNPMYVAVVSTILGQGLVLGNVALLEYRRLLRAGLLHDMKRGIHRGTAAQNAEPKAALRVGSS